MWGDCEWDNRRDRRRRGDRGHPPPPQRAWRIDFYGEENPDKVSRAQLSFNHALIYVRDVERALKFYRDHLGFRVISKMDGYARLKSPKGRTTLGLHLTEGKLAARTGSIRLYFEVTNLDAFCARLRRRGVKFSQMPKDMPWGWRHAYLDDPDGNEISLYFAGAKRLKAP